MTENEMINKWSKTGLLGNALNSFNEFEQLSLSEDLETMSNIVLKNSDTKLSKVCDNSFIFGMVFPIITRLYLDKIENIPTMEYIFDDFVNYVNKEYINLKKSNYKDWQAELMIQYMKRFETK